MNLKTIACFCATITALYLGNCPSNAKTNVVTSLNDSGAGTLRGIIAGPLAAGDTINFAANLSGQTITLTSGEVQLDQNVVIDASSLPGGIQINGNHNSRIFEVFSNVTAVITGLTITNGYASAGGGILNSSGRLTLNRCTIAGNSVSSGGGGGGIYNNLGILTLHQCTVANNSASAGNGAGGGIFNLTAGLPVTLNQCTVSGNSAGTGGGFASVNFIGTNNVTFFNTIVAGNSAGSGLNVDGATTPFLLGTNLTSGNALLASLGNYGGPTPTMPPLPGSPAIDAGSDAAANAPYNFATDQRGRPRVSGAHADIGAVETQTYVVTSLGDSGPGSLRAAAAAAVGGGIVTFASNLSGQTIQLTSAEIPLAGILAIDASTLPAGITINGGDAMRIFNVGSGANITLTGLVITHGRTPDAGGAIYSAAGSSLHIAQCAFFGNSALEGGAILNDGTLLMENCTFTANNGGYGGALQCRNATVLNNCTIANNDAPNGGGGVFNKGSTLTLNNCIVALNTGGNDLFNQLASVVYSNANLIPAIIYDRSTGTNGPTPLFGAPLLSNLGNYGGPTPTMPPLLGSPAIDAGGPTALLSDQRGFPRAVGPAPDLGAVEFSIINPVVTTTADSGVGSFRYAVDHCMAGTTVTFDPSLSGQTITLTTGQMTVTNINVTIDASALPGGIFISGNNASRIFAIYNPSTLVLNSLMIKSCNSSQGGAIYSAGVMTIRNCSFFNNTAKLPGAASGGAIYNDGNVTLMNSTLAGNLASYFGGAIFNQGTLAMLACTVSGNSAGEGGAFYNNGAVNITNCIIAGNMLPNNKPNNIHGSFSGTPNLIGDNPLLAPLGDYGGPTQTMPPLPGSPAIDAGAATSLTTDQRGFPRVLGVAPDIGAVEGVFNSAGPGTLTGVKRLGNGTLQFGFTNYSDSSFSILAATNVALPLNAWSNLGLALETPLGSGHFQFTDPQATNNSKRFYRVKSP